jgi:hypothetical protein
MLSCLLSLLLYAGLVSAYYYGLRNDLEAPAIYWVSGIVGFLTTLALGALRNGWMTGKDAACVRNLDWSMMPRDGQRVAIAGRLEALGDTIIAPLSGRTCLIYEYELSRYSTSTNTSGETESQNLIDFAGIGMAPCIVRGDARSVELHGFPTMTNIETESYGDTLEDMARARRYLLATSWKDCSGKKIFAGAGHMLRSLFESEGSSRHDWRMVNENNCAWLDPAKLPDDGRPIEPSPSRLERAAQADLEEDDDDLEDDLDEEETSHDEERTEDSELNEDGEPLILSDLYLPFMEEKRIEAGEEVVAIGHFDSLAFSLKAKVSSTGDTLKIYRDTRENVVEKLNSESRGYFKGAILTLILVHAVLALGMWIYRQNKKQEGAAWLEAASTFQDMWQS